MKLKKINVAAPYIDNADRLAVLEVLKSGHLSLGPKYKEFETMIAEYSRSRYAVTVSSGTAGLHLAVKACGIKEGDEVITTPFSFIASSNCILYEKACPVFVDIEEKNFNIDPAKIEQAITRKTRAILVVHIFGQTADMTPIMKIAGKYRLKVIEDACESIGAEYKKKMAGTIGNVGIYAFYPNKQMTTGEGGVIITNKKRIYDLCVSLRNQGRDPNDSWLRHSRLGYNYRMDEMSAALGISQFKKLKLMMAKKKEIADRYNQNFKSMEDIIIPEKLNDRIRSWFVYVIRFRHLNRNYVLNKLQDMGIETKPYLPAIHLQQFMKKMFRFKTGDFPIAENVAASTLALPFYIGLDNKTIDYICDKIKQIIWKKRK